MDDIFIYNYIFSYSPYTRIIYNSVIKFIFIKSIFIKLFI